MEDARKIANELIRFGVLGDTPITNLQLQKLLYFGQGYHLAIDKYPLFENPIEAWDYGPVVPDVYAAVKMDRAKDGEKDQRVALYKSLSGYGYCEDDMTVAIAKKMFDKFIDWDPWELVKLTHQPGSPWYVTRKKNKKVIDIGLIQRDFEKLLRIDY